MWNFEAHFMEDMAAMIRDIAIQGMRRQLFFVSLITCGP